MKELWSAADEMCNSFGDLVGNLKGLTDQQRNKQISKRARAALEVVCLITIFCLW